MANGHLVPHFPKHLADLRPILQNPRRHGRRNIATITSSLREVGAARSIVIDEAGTVLAGNATVQAAAEAGITKLRVVDADGRTIVAVRRIGLTPGAKTRLALYDNRSAELAEGWDPDILKALSAAGVSLDGLWSEAELPELLGLAPAAGLTDPDQVPEERPTSIKAGDLFELGRHRLLCGDSTNAHNIGRLLGDAKPTLMVTDPPYGVDYDPAWRARAGLNRNTRKLGKVANDDVADWRSAWARFPGCVAYVWHAGLKAGIVADSLTATGFELRSQIIWAKDRLALSRGDYHWQHEPCWYAVRSGQPSRRTDDRTQTTLWTIPARDDSGHGHGTQKPVECMARAMRNHERCEVYEPFSGSGTTLIAGEQLERRCFAVEIEPRYVQVAIDRWEAFTGKKAVKVGEAVCV